MRRIAGRSYAVAAIALCAGAGPTAFGAHAQAPSSSVRWTKISANTSLGIASAGLWRTADGKLHVVWPSHDGLSGYSLHYSTLSPKAKLLNTGTIIRKWASVAFYPRLVPGSSGGIRLVFSGGDGKGGSPYNLGGMYSATSGAAGASWALTHGSMSHSTLVPLTDDSAVAQANGTPVAGWPAGPNFAYHVGVDPNSPATAPDRLIGLGAGGVVVGSTMARDKNGSIWAAWFNNSFARSQGYYAVRVLPSVTAKVKAPNSGGKNVANNQPLQSVAFAARVGGGEYLAYCVPSKTVGCVHVVLWKVGSAKTRIVPGSATGRAAHVAIAAGPGGHLWILWYDTGLNEIRLVRTNAAATSFGSVRTIAAPPSTIAFDGLQAEGSRGPLDVIALILQAKAGSTPSYWDTQLP